jgi:uncharacterized membrane protein
MRGPDRERLLAAVSAVNDSGPGRWAASLLGPVGSAPSASLESALFLDAYLPTVMPRTSVHQGLAVGINTLCGRAASGIFELGRNAALPAGAALPTRLVSHGIGAALGYAMEQRPQSDVTSETVTRDDIVRVAGTYLKLAATSSALYDLATESSKKMARHRAADPIVVSALATAGLAYWTSKRLKRRKEVIERWPIPQYSTLLRSASVGLSVSTAASIAGRGFSLTRNALVGYLGPGWSKNLLGRAANVGIWATASSAAFNGFIGYVGRANERVEPGYATPPESRLVSGGPGSVAPFDELGLQGRRFVSHAISAERIEAVMGVPAAAEPIRVYVGFNTEPVYQAGRAELALEELERTGAFDRSYLLLVSPTGTGWVDNTVVEAAELLTRGDMATCCIQYGRFPSPLCIQKLPLGRSQFRLLLWGIRQRLADRPVENRPKVLVFGESLGAWAASDVVMHQGISGLDHYGIDRALWFGLPGFAKWSRNGMTRGSNALVPPGTVGVFDRAEQLYELSASDRARLRAVLLSHENDPIALMEPSIAVKEPNWLKGEQDRGRGVPEGMTWQPITTFWQVTVDAANSMVTVPGDFRSFGHDYRADTAVFVQEGYQLPAPTSDQLRSVEAVLRDLELQRTARSKLTWAEVGHAKPPLSAARRQETGGVPLLQHRSGRAQWRRSVTRGRATAPPSRPVDGATT